MNDRRICNFLTDESKWTKGEVARDIDGFGVDVEDPRAVCFCTIGLIEKFYHREYSEVYLSIRAEINRPIIDWNDHSANFDDVKSVFCKLDL